MGIGCVGYILLIAVPDNLPGLKYFAIFLAASGIYPLIVRSSFAALSSGASTTDPLLCARRSCASTAQHDHMDQQQLRGRLQALVWCVNPSPACRWPRDIALTQDSRVRPQLQRSAWSSASAT